MSRLARMVVPGLPHHVTRRGNRREAIFFEDGDQQLCCDMLGEQLRKFRVEVSEPVRVGRLGRVAPEVCGIVRQSESGSGPACVSCRGMGWSGVRAHLAGEDDRLVSVRPVLDRWPTFRDLLLEDCEGKFISLREAEGIGRPLGTAGFVTELERRLSRPIARRAPGRKAVAIAVGEQLNWLQSVSCHRISPTCT
jgi:REP-associated tyrosine transposase